MVMIKPGMPFLDVIHAAATNFESSVCFISPDEPFCQRMVRKIKVKEYSIIPII